MKDKTLDRRDNGLGFFIAGLRPTKNKLVMSTGVFTSADTVLDAIKFGKIAFQCDNLVERVEIQGRKSFKVYYLIVKNKAGEIVVKPNTDGKIKTKAFYSASTVAPGKPMPSIFKTPKTK